MLREIFVIALIGLFIGAGISSNISNMDKSIVRAAGADDPSIIKVTDNNQSDSWAYLYQDPTCKYYLAWVNGEDPNTPDIYLTKSCDWREFGTSPHVQVTSYYERDSHPAIVHAVNGDLLMAFSSTRGTPFGWKTYLWRSTDNGNTWSDPMLIEGYCSGNPDLLRVHDGTLYLSLHVLGSYTKVFKSTDNGFTWTHISTISNHPYVLNSEMREYNDVLYMVCDSRQDINPNPSDIYFYKSTDGGYTWVETSDILSDHEDCWPTFIRGDDGRFMVVWASNNRDTPGAYNLYYSTSYDFATWTPPKLLFSDTPYNDSFPYLLKDDSGNIILAWSSDRDGDYEIYIKKISEGLPFFDGFENIASGSYPGINGWKNMYSGSTAYVSTEEAYSGSKSFCLKALSNWARTDYIQISPPKKLTYECYVKVKDISRGTTVGFSIERGAYNPRFNCIRFNNTGFILFEKDYWNGPYTVLQPYSADVWYKIRVDLDYTVNKADVYINDVLKASNLDIYPRNFYHAQWGNVTLDKFSLALDNFEGSGVSTVYFDNVRIYETPTVTSCGDVNCDGDVNMGDVILLLNHVTHPEDPRYELNCCDA